MLRLSHLLPTTGSGHTSPFPSTRDSAVFHSNALALREGPKKAAGPCRQGKKRNWEVSCLKLSQRGRKGSERTETSQQTTETQLWPLGNRFPKLCLLVSQQQRKRKVGTYRAIPARGAASPCQQVWVKGFAAVSCLIWGSVPQDTDQTRGLDEPQWAFQHQHAQLQISFCYQDKLSSQIFILQVIL